MLLKTDIVFSSSIVLSLFFFVNIVSVLVLSIIKYIRYCVKSVSIGKYVSLYLSHPIRNKFADLGHPWQCGYGLLNKTGVSC